MFQSRSETVRNNLLLEGTHKATGLQQRVAEIASSLVPIIQGHFCMVSMDWFYIAFHDKFL